MTRKEYQFHLRIISCQYPDTTQRDTYSCRGSYENDDQDLQDVQLMVERWVGAGSPPTLLASLHLRPLRDWRGAGHQREGGGVV